jgi:hypothetical protein
VTRKVPVGKGFRVSGSNLCRRVDAGEWRAASTGMGDESRPPFLQAGYPRSGRKAVSGVARPKGVEMAGPGETLGIPWPPLLMRP